MSWDYRIRLEHESLVCPVLNVNVNVNWNWNWVEGIGMPEVMSILVIREYRSSDHFRIA